MRKPGTAWGGKDLLDTAGIATTYGAEFYRTRIPKADSAVVRRLHEAGAVLVAKLSLGALRDEVLTVTNLTGHPSLTLRAGFVEVSEARSDWAPDPAHPPPKFSPPRRVPHGVTLIGRLFEEGTLGRAGVALEREFAAMSERPPGF